MDTTTTCNITTIPPNEVLSEVSSTETTYYISNSVTLNDFETLIKLDCRGTLIKVYKYTLAKSVYFCCLLGINGSQMAKPQEDGSYFIDCDEDVFRELLCYMEYGFTRTVKFRPEYIKNLCDKFGIESQEKIKLTKEEKEIKLRQNEDKYEFDMEQKKRNKENIFKNNLLKMILEHVSLGNTKFRIDFVSARLPEFKVINNEKLVCVYNINGEGVIKSILSSDDLFMDFIKPISIDLAQQNKTIIICEKQKKYDNKFIVLSIQDL